MNLRLRELTSAADVEALEPLFTRALEEAGCESPATADAILARSRAAPESLLVVAEDSAHATLGLALSMPFADPLTGEVTPMLVLAWVDPAIRHRGVARALVQEVRRILQRAGMNVLLARVPHGDDPVLAMGERWGLVRSWEILSSE